MAQKKAGVPNLFPRAACGLCSFFYRNKSWQLEQGLDDGPMSNGVYKHLVRLSLFIFFLLPFPSSPCVWKDFFSFFLCTCFLIRYSSTTTSTADRRTEGCFFLSLVWWKRDAKYNRTRRNRNPLEWNNHSPLSLFDWRAGVAIFIFLFSLFSYHSCVPPGLCLCVCVCTSVITWLPDQLILTCFFLFLFSRTMRPCLWRLSGPLTAPSLTLTTAWLTWWTIESNWPHAWLESRILADPVLDWAWTPGAMARPPAPIPARPRRISYITTTICLIIIIISSSIGRISKWRARRRASWPIICISRWGEDPSRPSTESALARTAVAARLTTPKRLANTRWD